MSTRSLLCCTSKVCQATAGYYGPRFFMAAGNRVDCSDNRELWPMRAGRRPVNWLSTEGARAKHPNLPRSAAYHCRNRESATAERRPKHCRTAAIGRMSRIKAQSISGQHALDDFPERTAALSSVPAEFMIWGRVPAAQMKCYRPIDRQRFNR